MIILNLNSNKALVKSTGTIFPGETGVTGKIALPTDLDGVAIGGEGWTGNVYIKYGTSGSEDYEEIALDGCSGNQEFDIPDEVTATAGNVTLWAEFTDGEALVITRECSITISAHSVYSAPAAQEGGDD